MIYHGILAFSVLYTYICPSVVPPSIPVAAPGNVQRFFAAPNAAFLQSTTGTTTHVLLKGAIAPCNVKPTISINDTWVVNVTVGISGPTCLSLLLKNGDRVYRLGQAGDVVALMTNETCDPEEAEDVEIGALAYYEEETEYHDDEETFVAGSGFPTIANTAARINDLIRATTQNVALYVVDPKKVVPTFENMVEMFAYNALKPEKNPIMGPLSYHACIATSGAKCQKTSLVSSSYK